MNLGKVVRTVIKVAPIVYPIVKKFMANKKTTRSGFKVNGRDY
ncbi:hypothetical protein [Ureibacillus aquaedulcis]|uniref:Uncharacterized protein n=1 Tax=Ureibacillus aquaedulcis TaxID=3058421 RepID=A0ABT8GUG1_9BACL|nr:hypothetical protein [Ureibacillus sp. BA0131]MDN4495057.1 hypothetical protein [Ureibacillus sp. BA0131]